MPIRLPEIMPFIHIRALPREDPLDVAELLETLSREFAAATGIDVQHVSATWTWLHDRGGFTAAVRRYAGTNNPLVLLLGELDP